MVTKLFTAVGLVPLSNQHTVSKGWGYEQWLWNNDGYCGKKLVFINGKKCSWHFHKKKDEVFYIQSGRLMVRHSKPEFMGCAWVKNTEADQKTWFNDINCANETILEVGDTFHVPPFMRHRMEALSDTVMFEFSTIHKDEDSFCVIKGD